MQISFDFMDQTSSFFYSNYNVNVAWLLVLENSLIWIWISLNNLVQIESHIKTYIKKLEPNWYPMDTIFITIVAIGLMGV